MRTLPLLLLLLATWPPTAAQDMPVPVVTADERFVVFHNGRFTRLEERPARQVVVQPGRLIYLDHHGQLKVFRSEERVLNLLDRGPVRDFAGTAVRTAWLVGDTLRTLHSGRVVELGRGVERFTVSDSLVTFHEHVAGTLQVWHRGRLHQLATVERGTEGPQWAQGRNAVLFHEQEGMRLLMYHRERTEVLVDSTRMALVAAAGGPVAWWDEHLGVLRVLDDAGIVEVSTTRPVRIKASSGALAFVDGTLRLKVYQGGAVVSVTDTMPAGFDVVDSVVVFPWANRLMRTCRGATVTVEPYIPEAWAVSGGRLAYLDLNRSPLGVEADGRPLRFGRERNATELSVSGDAVVFIASDGSAHVVRRGKEYTYAP